MSDPPLVLPPTPDGYAEPYEFTYPTVGLLVASSVVGLVASALAVAALVAIHGVGVFAFYEVTVDGDATVWTLDLTAILAPFVVALLVTVVVHELIHGAAFRRFGYEVTYGAVPSMGALYAGAFGAFQRREEVLWVGAAPLFVVTAVAVPLLFVPVPAVAITAAFVLVLNTSGSVGDCYALARIRRMPGGTLLYDVDIDHSYVYEPDVNADARNGTER
ncbi:DUF3267 domain-containing protein [Halorubrum sp. JWXQ-INN 858]|uniref:metalloprotease family protein n=1 Tax=Halorubrum sp. JWXQ-INN 858 TaxID=2690782 RepID=UPI0013575DA8|nr:DUF3267 domain-containing protein [Halorubrum sp. JWXQ-INN 858]MWV64905.1 DUF3267 domain-containing protein [Halorubrum sp. JWXQ-INN 858]